MQNESDTFEKLKTSFNITRYHRWLVIGQEWRGSIFSTVDNNFRNWLNIDTVIRVYYNECMNSALVQARLRPELKQEAERLLTEIGLSPSEAIRVFYTQITIQGGIPFEMKVPNKETIQALEEMNDPEKRAKLKRYTSANDLMSDILNEDSAWKPLYSQIGSKKIWRGAKKEGVNLIK